MRFGVTAAALLKSFCPVFFSVFGIFALARKHLLRSKGTKMEFLSVLEGI